MTRTSPIADDLLRQEPAAVDPARIADAVTRRERRRVRAWTIASAALWIVTTAYLFGLLWFYLVFVHPVVYEAATSDFDHAAMRPQMYIITRLLLISLGWPVSLLASALCTTVMIVVSRRATLRQIQRALEQIGGRIEGLASRSAAGGGGIM